MNAYRNLANTEGPVRIILVTTRALVKWDIQELTAKQVFLSLSKCFITGWEGRRRKVYAP